MTAKHYLIDKDVDTYLQDAKGIAWDTCHKIYILMDDKQMKQMAEYEYDPLISSDEMDADEMLNTVARWWEESCGLRFVQAVETMPNGEQEFDTIIDQFEDEEEDEEDY